MLTTSTVPQTRLMPFPITTAAGQLDDILSQLCETLQLTATQYRSAVERYRAVGDWLDAPESALARWHPHIYPQGSLLIGTTVHPWRRFEYDLDLVCELQADWRLFP